MTRIIILQARQGMDMVAVLITRTIVGGGGEDLCIPHLLLSRLSTRDLDKIYDGWGAMSRRGWRIITAAVSEAKGSEGNVGKN